MMSLGSMCCCTYPRSFTAMNFSFHVDLAMSFRGIVWQKAFQSNGFMQYLPSAASSDRDLKIPAVSSSNIESSPRVFEILSF